ncbi:MAG TPA: hypothetical protein VN039_06345 [Nitrospira sp.]|nr:hypothetical protein [Nitrospira sp.]
MTRKHYIATAAMFADMMDGMSIIGSNFIAGYARAIVDAANNMADIFEADNPRFDRDKFIKACGL